MRTLILTAWLLVPLAVVAYHYGPGQKHMVVDDTGRLLKLAEAHTAAGQQLEAIDAYKQALAIMPEKMVDKQQRVRLEMAKLQMTSQMLPDAYLGLTALVEELRDNPPADPQFTREAQAALANSQYYLTWLLRLEGAPREVWEPEIEAARQTFRKMAEDTAKTDGKSDKNPEAKQYREDLEAVVRLARMDLDELQGLSLPSQCRGCCSGKCKGSGKGKGKGKGKSKGGEKKKDARGASSGPPPDNAGS